MSRPTTRMDWLKLGLTGACGAAIGYYVPPGPAIRTWIYFGAWICLVVGHFGAYILGYNAGVKDCTAQLRELRVKFNDELRNLVRPP